MDTNGFSNTWCELFLASASDGDIERQSAFIARHLPRPQYARILDLACGAGRHARALARAGYSVLGVDRSLNAVAAAARSGEGATFQVLDMREVERLDGSFDGVVNLWQSFGFFDATTNRAVLEQLHRKLRPRGRLLLDVYNREHAIARPSLEHGRRSEMAIETRRSWAGPRLSIELWYDGVLGDRFDWHVYSPRELCSLCGELGFEVVLGCAWFDESLRPSAEHARMQWLFERR